MAYIYKIINDINNKIYVGKTNYTILDRWKQHKADCKKITKEKRPLYNAINKYGIEHFSIQEIEQCNEKEAAEREQYWISFYNSYKEGYNATYGGDGKTLLDYSKILQLYDNTKMSLIEIAKQCNCCVDSIRKIISANRENPNWEERKNFGKKSVLCIEEKLIFPSLTEAAQWLTQKKGISFTSGNSHISKVCKGLRKTCGGYHWEYVKN